MCGTVADTLQISKNRRVAISEFKGKQLIMIREYYEKNDEMLPGKKVFHIIGPNFSMSLTL